MFNTRMNYLHVQNPIRSLFRSFSSTSLRSIGTSGTSMDKTDVRIAVMGASGVGKTALHQATPGGEIRWKNT